MFISSQYLSKLGFNCTELQLQIAEIRRTTLHKISECSNFNLKIISINFTLKDVQKIQFSAKQLCLCVLGFKTIKFPSASLG